MCVFYHGALAISILRSKKLLLSSITANYFAGICFWRSKFSLFRPHRTSITSWRSKPQCIFHMLIPGLANLLLYRYKNEKYYNITQSVIKQTSSLQFKFFLLLYFLNSFSLLSSPEPNSQVSFFDHNLSGVRCRQRRCRCCYKLLFFFTGLISTRLRTKYSWVKGFKFVQMKDHTHFQV